MRPTLSFNRWLQARATARRQGNQLRMAKTAPAHVKTIQGARKGASSAHVSVLPSGALQHLQWRGPGVRAAAIGESRIAGKGRLWGWRTRIGETSPSRHCSRGKSVGWPSAA